MFAIIKNWKIWPFIAGAFVIILGLLKYERSRTKKLEDKVAKVQHDGDIKTFEAVQETLHETATQTTKDTSNEKEEREFNDLDRRLNGGITVRL